jgi:translation initiation factor IF-1
MSKELIELDGIVLEALPNAVFKVNINGNILLAYVNGKIRKNNIRISVGDSVKVEMSPYDLYRGRITYRNG